MNEFCFSLRASRSERVRTSAASWRIALFPEGSSRTRVKGSRPSIILSSTPRDFRAARRRASESPLRARNSKTPRNRRRTPSALEMNDSLRMLGSMTAPSSGTRTVHELDRTTLALRSEDPRTRSRWRVGGPSLVRRTSAWRNPHAPQRIVVCKAPPKYGISSARERIRRPGAPHAGQDVSMVISLTGGRSPLSGTGQTSSPRSINSRVTHAEKRRLKYGIVSITIQQQVT